MQGLPLPTHPGDPSRKVFDFMLLDPRALGLQGAYSRKGKKSTMAPPAEPIAAVPSIARSTNVIYASSIDATRWPYTLSMIKEDKYLAKISSNPRKQGKLTV